MTLDFGLTLEQLLKIKTEKLSLDDREIDFVRRYLCCLISRNAFLQDEWHKKATKEITGEARGMSGEMLLAKQFEERRMTDEIQQIGDKQKLIEFCGSILRLNMALANLIAQMDERASQVGGQP